MENMGFDARWINWTMQCISTVKYKIIVSGEEIKEVKPSRGLRQGDPLSPYLFLFVSDVLSNMISNAVKKKELIGLKLAKTCPVLSHLFFADDSIFFLQAVKESCMRLKQILEEYCTASGQKINYDKSSLYFSANTTKETKEMVCSILEMSETKDPG